MSPEKHTNPEVERQTPTPTSPQNRGSLIPAPRPSPLTPWTDTSREGLNPEKILFGLRLPFNPPWTETLLDVEKFEHLEIDKVRQWVSGLVLDVDGTLVPHHSNDFPPAVVEKLKEIQGKMKMCIFSNNGQEREIFRQLGIPVIKHVPPKPSPEGFKISSEKLGLSPNRCAMVGDNILTDGGARQTGMQLILVDPIPGPEGIFHKITRGYGRMVKSAYDGLYGATSPLKKRK